MSLSTKVGGLEFSGTLLASYDREIDVVSTRRCGLLVSGEHIDATVLR
jgi:hypothetical protein